MKIKTLQFGEIEVAGEELLNFPEGLLGFGTLKQFAILESPDIQPFVWLQAVEDPNISFVIVDPLLVMAEYQIQVRPEDIADLELEDPGEAKVLAIVVVPADPQQATINLKGPLVINPRNRRGKQIVLADTDYSTRQPIWPETTEQEDASCSS